MKKKVSDVDKIMNNLYLGNYLASEDKLFFKENGVSAVLNATVSEPFLNNKTENLRISVEDDLKQSSINKMTKMLDLGANFIYKHVNVEKQPILVHCVAGRQRSASLVLAYLMKYKCMTIKQAFDFLREKRPEVFHWGESFNFEKSIKIYYEEFVKGRKHCKK